LRCGASRLLQRATTRTLDITGARTLDPVAIYLLIVIFVIGPLFAAGYIWLDRRISHRTGSDRFRLTPIGAFFIVAFVAVMGVAVVYRQFYPETKIGAWLQADELMATFIVGCIAVLFVIEAFLRRLGRPTAVEKTQRDV
jgi:heme/copper-type cytochrome/quinol oxidase subunit 1